ncbi:CcdC protein domain-containing protein [Phenylobacterium soli]|uniref:DUF1453 domain-containing protein n=1 Tax=Phenylobacterium soli TaxID=2170551 RepID=A0A328AKD2_9CAUL|nr:CcdC protein domain-containing protein [Phenylobacterium soli]RAK55290.1 hypothetical protein DJ017_12590 [Phenylobacterium soli]
MQHQPANLGVWAYLFPLIAIGMVILRNSRARRLRIEALWVSPLVILLLVGLALAQEGVPSPAGLALDIAALALGALLGWWRGRFTHITVDPETHALTSRASPVGMLLILGIFALRYGLRTFAAENAGALHMSVSTVADAALVITVGLVCAQRLEIALRASRLLAEARAAKAA